MNAKDEGRSRPSMLMGVYAIWWREFTVFFRETPRMVSALISPVIWLFVFGAGMGSSFSVDGLDYQHFIFGGILVQTFLFSSLFYGAYLVWDRKIDVLKAVLVSPLDRTATFMGKVLGGVTVSLIESLIVLIVGIFIGQQYSPLVFLQVLAVVALASAGLTALGLAIGSVMDSPEGFQLLSSLGLFPLFFLSGALFPLTNLEGVLGIIAALNPVTYIVDLLRGLLSGVHYYTFATDAMAVAAFIVLANIFGAWMFSRMKS
jgi:ABC-2 type transport system permease protein